VSEHDIAAALAAVRQRIAAACARAGRAPDSARLLAASKFQSSAAIRAAYRAGQREFGENYVQELVRKADELSDLRDLRWHLIGHLQRNKVKDVVRVGCAVQTIDSVKLAEALAARARADGRTSEVWLQVNISEEPQKAGVSVAELSQLTAAVRAQPALALIGLMAIPKPSEDEAEQRAAFARMRELAKQHGVDQLSMGMSDDLELAIEAGATLVRVGTAIFGERVAPAQR
jgi:pyridoxal phosphate enzyme (YggS family)